MTRPRIEKDHIAPYRHEFAKRPTQCWKRLPSCEYRQHRRARRRAAKEELRNILQREGEMTSQKPFNALAYAISVLGQPDEVSKNRLLDASHGVISDAHMWRLPDGSGWLVVHEWSDGDQTTNAGAAGLTYQSGVRNNDDGSLCPAYEEHARWLIDAYAEVAK